jgi:hypothetical protein
MRGRWIRKLFRSSSREDEAAERDEYGIPAGDELEQARNEMGSFYAGAEATEAAEEELDELKPPADPAP